MSPGIGAVWLPWGLNIDGNGNVWVISGMTGTVVLLAGDDTKGHPPGTKTGDLTITNKAPNDLAIGYGFELGHVVVDAAHG